MLSYRTSVSPLQRGGDARLVTAGTGSEGGKEGVSEGGREGGRVKEGREKRVEGAIGQD